MSILKLSIVVPVYNVESYIEKCLLSLENQDLPKDQYEIIVVDDGSPDASVQIVERLLKEYSNIVLLRKVNGGLSSARNYGLKYARGEYVWFVDSDDYIEVDVLGRLIEELYIYRLDCLGFLLYDIREERATKAPESDRTMTDIVMSGTDYIKNCKISISACTHIYRRILLQDPHTMFMEGIIHEDQLFVLKIYELCQRMKELDLRVYNYVIKEGTIATTRTCSNDIRSLDSWNKIVFSLNRCFADREDDYAQEALCWLNNYKYKALTSLLVYRLPFKEKLRYFSDFEKAGVFEIGRTKYLSFRRRFRCCLYRCVFLYRTFLYLMCFFRKMNGYAA